MVIYTAPFVNAATESTPTGITILFSSGFPVALTSTLLGLAGLPGIVGVGYSAQGVDILGTTIDLSGAMNNFAYSVPQGGNIKSIAGYFRNTVAISLVLTTVTIKAQLYKATTGSNQFSVVAGSLVSLSPTLTNTVGVGTTFSGVIDSLSIPVNAGDRLIMVFSITASGLNLVNTVIGYANANVSIEYN